MPKTKPSFLYKNSLSIVFIFLTVVTLVGQAFTGWKEHNKELAEKVINEIPFTTYLSSGHFIQATFENWESEFLQMAMYVMLTVFLRQKGSAESKSLDEPEEVDREPKPHTDAPWPVKKGGIWLMLYKHSLTIAFFLLFLITFWLHAKGSLLDFNQQQNQEGKPAETMTQFLGNSKLWFESFQNWQSEFLSIAAVVIFSIFLRQKGSPESKPVDAPDSETGN